DVHQVRPHETVVRRPPLRVVGDADRHRAVAHHDEVRMPDVEGFPGGQHDPERTERRPAGLFPQLVAGHGLTLCRGPDPGVRTGGKVKVPRSRRRPPRLTGLLRPSNLDRGSFQTALIRAGVPQCRPYDRGETLGPAQAENAWSETRPEAPP